MPRLCAASACVRESRALRYCDMHYRRMKHSGRESLISESERFWSKVDKSSTCWLWRGATGDNGYGRFAIGSQIDGTRRTVQAHRYAYEVTCGKIPENLQLDHLCRVRNCVNPVHLEPVTIKVNVLRGETLAAENLAKTRCAQGHPYSGENLGLTNKGYRFCRTCMSRWQREYRARKKARNGCK